MKKFLIFTFLLLALSCSDAAQQKSVRNTLNHQTHFRHLEYLINLKNSVANKHWPDFAKSDFYQPVVYYTKEKTYVLNPNDHIRSISDYQELGMFGDVEVITLSNKYLDTTNFQFSNSYSSTDSTALYFQENVLSFQSFELVRKFIPDIVDIQDWSIMVIHELFHSYQRSITEHEKYYMKLKIPEGPDQYLGSYHKNLGWYRESVYMENELLKEIWIEGADPIQNLTKYDSLRGKRIDRVKSDYGIDIREVEDYEITIEGQARYFESLCKRFLSKNRPGEEILNSDEQALDTDLFEEYAISKDKGLFDIYNDRYYYQLGYNISMILETHNVNFKNSIYREKQSLHQYLEKLRAYTYPVSINTQSDATTQSPTIGDKFKNDIHESNS